MRYALILLLCASVLFAQDVDIAPTFEIKYQTQAGKYYQLQSTTDLTSETWVNEGDAFLGDGEEFQFLKPKDSDPKRFYRVEEVEDQLVLVWSDEFSGDSLDYSKWGKEENNYGGGNNEAQYYSTNSKYVFVEDGNLHISVYRDEHTSVDGKTSAYTSGRIRTLQRGDWTYGRFEVRAKVPGGEGIWPAIWMLPTETKYGRWAAGGEIDIVESRGNETSKTIGTIHFGDAWPNNQHKGTSYRLPSGSFDDGFYTYAVDWYEDRIEWYVDNVKYQTITKDEWNSAAAPTSDTAPFDKPFHMIINLAVNGGFFNGSTQDANNLPDSAFPQTLEVDYVRVYKRGE